MLTRRDCLAAASLATVWATKARARQLQTIGVQLYTVRTVLPKDPVGVLQALDSIGYREAEPTYAQLKDHGPAIKATSLKPVSVHLDTAMINNEAELDRAIALSKEYGITYAVHPYVMPAERNGVEGMRVLADKLNRAGERCRRAGLTLCYHNHAFEFEPKDGTTAWQVLLDRADKKLVSIELDMFWVSVAGEDPVAWLGKLAGRVPLIHVKDKARDTPVRYDESVPPQTFKEVGQGVFDWSKTLAAANAAGVKHYIVEQDQAPGDPVESLRLSFVDVSKVNF